MQRCLHLAEKGRSTVAPNPMVGCVIVHQNKIIGEGWHQKAGQPHAEVNAIANVKNKALLKGLNIAQGKVVYKEVAEAFDLEYIDASSLIQ